MKRRSDSRKLDRRASINGLVRPQLKTLDRFDESKRKLYFFLFDFYVPSFTGKSTGQRLGDKQNIWRN